MNDLPTLARCTEVFVNAFAMGKSVHHPYLVRQVGGVWIMQDGPGRKVPRKIEVVACEKHPDEVVEVVRRENLGWHFICAIEQPGADHMRVRAHYKALGYRAMSTEWMFAHRLDQIPVLSSDPPVRRVETLEVSKSIPQRATQKRKPLPGGRLYAVWDEVTDYGWVESIPFEHEAWVSGLYVFAESRGKGYGRALMSSLLQGDHAANAASTILLASSSGARLYPHLGFETVGTLHVFCPAKLD